MPQANGGTRVDVEEAGAWVRAHVPLAGPLEPFQVEPWAAVFRAPVDDGVVWFKACAPHHAFEITLTAALSARWSTTTEVLAHDGDRRWLLMADAGVSLGALGNPPQRWIEVLPAYAEVQVGETALAGEHLARGVPDLRLSRLPLLYEELLSATLPLDEAETADLASIGPRIRDWCEELESVGIPDTVQHDDLHMNNVYVKGSVLRVLDWGDASISHPFFSLFETFRFLVEVNRLSPGDQWFARLRDAYLEPWGPGHRATFDLAMRIGGAAHAIAWLHQRDALSVSDRLAFDDAFGVILRLALRVGKQGWAG